MADHPHQPTAADCCRPAAEPSPADPRIAGHFDKLTRQRTAGGVLPEMAATSEHLLAQLADVGSVAPTVLEFGCGSGALLVELLRRGASSADGVDLSAQAVETAGRRAEEAGVGERATFEVGDGARMDVTAHDWVVLDRAICCYPDMPALVAHAIAAARGRVIFSVPTSRGLRGWANRVAWGAESLWTRVVRGPCPGYVHDLDDIERRLTAAGFRRRSGRTDFLWYTTVWERASAAS